MPTFSNIGGAEPSTVTFRAGGVNIARGSTTEFQEIICLGDPTSSGAIAAVSSVAPAANEIGLVVRLAGNIQGNSTVFQGTSPWLISGNSTVVQGTSPWIIAGNSTVKQSGGDIWSVAVAGSVDSSQYLPVRLTNGSAFTTVDLPTIQSTTVTLNSSASTALYALVSSVASQRQKVFAYHVTSTATAATKLIFQSSNGTAVKFHVGFGSGSSGVTGANLSVTPPAWLFATAAGEALNATLSSTGVNVDVSISYFSEA